MIYHRCQNTEGSFTCVCPHGLVGDPIKLGCRQPGDCYTDSDCPSSAACVENSCRNPCDNPTICGRNAECNAVGHVAVCRCPGQFTGNPKVTYTRDLHLTVTTNTLTVLKYPYFVRFQAECVQLECNYHSDCGSSKACFENKCIDPCSVPNVCGQRADCSPLNHSAVCTCQPGCTGDPNLGCVPVQYCKSDSQCPTSSACNGGVCTCT